MTDWTEYTPAKSGVPHPDYREGMECEVFDRSDGEWWATIPSWVPHTTYRFRPFRQPAQETDYLTEQEAKGAWNASYHDHALRWPEYLDQLRKRGLIAFAPVDPLRQAVQKAWDAKKTLFYSAGSGTPSGEIMDDLDGFTEELRAHGVRGPDVNHGQNKPSEGEG